MCHVATIDRFHTTLLDWKLPTNAPLLMTAIQTHGVMAPVICVKDDQGLAIVDGQQRYRYAKKANQPTLPYVIITPDLPIMTLVSELHRHELNASTIMKLRLIRAFKAPITAPVLHHLGLPHYSHIKKDIDRICNASFAVQTFFHAKGYSLKESVNLLNQSNELRDQYIRDARHFQFSKRAFDTILCQSTAIMKRDQLSATAVLETLGYDTIRDADRSPSQRCAQWMSQLTGAHTPILNATRHTIDETLAPLQKTVKIHYDPTLENAGITLSAHIKKTTDVSDLVAWLNHTDTKRRLTKTLDLI
jgi:hypothetical protein